MAIPFLNHLDLRSVSELQNAILHKTTSGSASNVEGKIIYDTGTDTIKFYNGSAWISLGAEQNTTYDLSVEQTSGNNDNPTITLTGSDGTTDNLTITGGTNITVTRDSSTGLTIDAGAATTVGLTNSSQRSGSIELIAGTNVSITEDSTTGHFTFASTDTNTQNTTTLSFVTSSNDVVLRNTTGGAGSGNQDIKMVAGSNITLTRGDANTMTIASTDTNTDVDVSVGNLETRLGQIDSNVSIGNGSSVTVTIPGDLQVTGTTTTNNVETVSTSNGIIFEGTVADAHEGTLKGGAYSADRTHTLPDASGTVNLGYSTTVGGATTAEVTHNLNSRNVVVQLFDTSSYETVHADVVRTTVDTVDLTFASAPASGDITVLVTRVA
tara:strand:+ start:32 stop:1174 length:1143 start_codon:yes stop_codon:yes gene_type:complete